MEEQITLCGDNCIECPRYNAHSTEEYQKRCKEVCSEAEYDMLEKAFFDKENSLRK